MWPKIITGRCEIMQLMSCKEKIATGTKLWKTCNYGDSEDEALRKEFKINVPIATV